MILYICVYVCKYIILIRCIRSPCIAFSRAYLYGWSLWQRCYYRLLSGGLLSIYIIEFIHYFYVYHVCLILTNKRVLNPWILVNCTNNVYLDICMHYIYYMQISKLYYKITVSTWFIIISIIRITMYIMYLHVCFFFSSLISQKWSLY